MWYFRGQDSTTCLYWALQEFGPDQVETITFDYGQRHRIEIDCVRQIAQLAGVPNAALPINTFNVLGGNALADENVGVAHELNEKNNLPNTFVPVRNLIFLTFAAAYAYQRDIEHLVTGVAQTDYSGYPDCRQNTVSAIELAIRLGMESRLKIHTPLMFISKRETVELARKVGALASDTVAGLMPRLELAVAEAEQLREDHATLIDQHIITRAEQTGYTEKARELAGIVLELTVLSNLRASLTGNNKIFYGTLVLPSVDVPSWRNQNGERFADRHVTRIQ